MESSTRAGTVIKPFPAGLSFISSRGRVIFLLETIWRERGRRGARKILNRHCSQHNTPCQEQVKTSPCGFPPWETDRHHCSLHWAAEATKAQRG